MSYNTRNLVGRESVAWVQIPPSPPTKKEPLSTKTKVLFLNDVCLRQMMTASPNDVRCANDAWLRHIWRQTSHHCGTQWSNIIFAKQMHHIAAGDASLKIQGFALIYLSKCDIINSPINKNLARGFENDLCENIFGNKHGSCD